MAASCASATSCTAVGGYETSTGEHQGLIVTGAGTSWQAITAPRPSGLPADASIGIGSVTCPTPTACVAVGRYLIGDYAYGLIYTGSGTSWAVADVPAPGGAIGVPYSVTCATASACIISGTYGDGSGAHGLLVVGSAGSWTAVDAPLPAGGTTSGNTAITSAACSSATACAAIGFYRDDAGHYRSWLLKGSGTSWTSSKAPLPLGADPNQDSLSQFLGLESISCAATGLCAASGIYRDTSQDYQGWLLTLSAGSWTTTQAPLPGPAAANPVFTPWSVACPPALSCVAVGQYDAPSQAEQGVLLTGPS